MRYYEQIIEGRTVINAIGDEKLGRIVDAVNAPCWIEAKRMLGYYLSTIQEHLLERFYEDRKEARRKK